MYVATVGYSSAMSSTHASAIVSTGVGVRSEPVMAAILSVSRLIPIATAADLHIQRDGQVRGIPHPGADDALRGIPLPRRDLDDELVVDLQQDPGRQRLLAELLVDAEQGDLHDVGGAALDRGVQRRPLRVLSQDAIRAGQI